MKPHQLRNILMSLVFLVFASESLVFFYSRDPIKDQQFDYILLLGVSGPTTQNLAIDRAKNTIEALSLWPQAQLIITGNEKFREVSRYKEYLKDSGYNTSKFLVETQSTDTWENIAFSKKIIPEGSRVLIITTEFHQPRSLAIARVQGLRASLFGRDPRSYSAWFIYFVRERGANIKWLFNFLIYKLT